MATYRLTGTYDQPLVDPDEWVGAGRPIGAYPTHTLRPGDPIEFRNDDEKKRLLDLGVVEEVKEGDASAGEDAEREIEERRKAAEQEQESLSGQVEGEAPKRGRPRKSEG